jgi:hypothetical protein
LHSLGTVSCYLVINPCCMLDEQVEQVEQVVARDDIWQQPIQRPDSCIVSGRSSFQHFSLQSLSEKYKVECSITSYELETI